MMVDYLSSQPDWTGYQVSTKKGSGPTMQIFHPHQRGHRVNMTFNMEAIRRQHHTHHFL